MKFEIVGIKSLVGLKSRKGQELNAYVLHMFRKNTRDEGLFGVEVKQQYTDASLLNADVKNLGGYGNLVGCEIDISYSDNGFVDSVELTPNV